MTPALILPKSAIEPRRVLRCTVPGCKAGDFPMDQWPQFTRHVKACSKRNADRMEAKVAEIEGNYFSSPADKELYAHIRKGGN